nr:ribonuclease H-like domain-containing protein [Tanacetum cinerariifolium]
MESQSETTQTVYVLKLLVLKTREYELWRMRMEQYLTCIDHALWEVIVNGVSVTAVASAGAEGPIPPKTAEQMLARKNELKAKSTLMLAILDEHLLKFHACKDAKSLWKAIKNRFRGNKESKKMQKTILKQNYGNFAASSQERLDKTYDWFQKLISQLEIHDEVISQEDANLKLLRSLSSAWNNIALILKNKYDLDTLSMDDLYNNLKVYESEIKGQSSSSLNSQNVAFVSSDNTSSTNETVNTAHNVSAASSKDQAFTVSYIYTDDLEEMDLKWQVAMLTIRVKRFIQITGRKVDLNGKETVVFDKTKVKCYNYHRRSHFAREYRALRNQEKRNRDAPTKNALVDTSTTNALVVQDGIDINVKESEVLNNVVDSCESDGDDNQESDSEDENVFESKEVKKIVKPSLEKIEFVNAMNTTIKNENKAEKPRKAAASVSTARHVNTAASRPNVNSALPITYYYFKAPSPVRRPFDQKSIAKTNNFNEKVNTAKVNNVTTTGPKAVVSAAEGNGNNDVKGCMLNLLNHPFNIDLMLIELGSFDAIIGMDWLARYQAIIVCAEKIVRIPWGNETLIIHGDGSNRGNATRLSIISCTKTEKYVKKGFPIFLAHITMKEVEDKSKEKQLEDVPIV